MPDERREKGRTAPALQAATIPPELTQFYNERREVLLSMDAERIWDWHASHNKGGTRAPLAKVYDEVFWRGVHKARCAAADLPMRERLLSQAWLYAHDSKPIFPVTSSLLDHPLEDGEFDEWRKSLVWP